MSEEWHRLNESTRERVDTMSPLLRGGSLCNIILVNTTTTLYGRVRAQTTKERREEGKKSCEIEVEKGKHWKEGGKRADDRHHSCSGCWGWCCQCQFSQGGRCSQRKRREKAGACRRFISHLFVVSSKEKRRSRRQSTRRQLYVCKKEKEKECVCVCLSFTPPSISADNCQYTVVQNTISFTGTHIIS